MTFFIKVGITILILIAITIFAIMIDKLIILLNKVFSARFVFFLLCFVLLIIKVASTLWFGSILQWSYVDTAFVTSMCFFALGWFTTITLKASLNREAALSRYITKERSTHDFSPIKVTFKDPYFVSSLFFLVISWGSALIMYKNYF